MTGCLFCGGDPSAPNHRALCDGRQGHAEATAAADQRFREGFSDVARLEDATTAAVDLAYAGAPPGWADRALLVVERLAREHFRFTTDSVWDHIEAPPEPRALGGVMRRAVAAGWIQQTDAFEKSMRGERHRAPMRVWQSLVVRGSEVA